MTEPTVKLTIDEWTNLITALVKTIGAPTAMQILRNALGDDRANPLLEAHSGERLTKRENHAIIRELYPHIPGDNLAQKEDWILAEGRNCFDSDTRFLQVLRYVRARMESFENAGGTLEEYPEHVVDLTPSEFPTGMRWLHTDVSAWPVTSALTARIEGGHLVMDYDKARVWPGKDTTAGSGLNANPHLIVEEDGQWYDGTFEWMRFGQTSKPLHTLAGDHVKVSPLSGSWRLQPGQRFGVMVSGLCRHTERNVQERTNVCWLVWR